MHEPVTASFVGFPLTTHPLASLVCAARDCAGLHVGIQV